MSQPGNAPELCHLGGSLSNNTCSLKCLSTRDAASCCLPRRSLLVPGPPIPHFQDELLRQRSPRRRFEPHGTCERPHGRSSSSQRRGVWGAFQVHDESDGHIAMSGEDHRQTICPAGFEGRPAQPTCASQSRPPKTRGMPAALRMCASCTTSMRMMRQRTATCHHRGLPHNSPLTVARQPTGDNLLSPKRCEPAMTTLTANPTLQESAPGTSVALTTYSANGPRRKTDVPTECPRLSCPVDFREDPCRLILSTPVQRGLLPQRYVFNTSQAVGLTPSLFHTLRLTSVHSDSTMRPQMLLH